MRRRLLIAAYLIIHTLPHIYEWEEMEEAEAIMMTCHASTHSGNNHLTNAGRYVLYLLYSTYARVRSMRNIRFGLWGHFCHTPLSLPPSTSFLPLAPQGAPCQIREKTTVSTHTRTHSNGKGLWATNTVPHRKYTQSYRAQEVT